MWQRKIKYFSFMIRNFYFSFYKNLFDVIESTLPETCVHIISCGVLSLSIGLHLHCSLTVSRSCNSSKSLNQYRWSILVRYVVHCMLDVLCSSHRPTVAFQTWKPNSFHSPLTFLTPSLRLLSYLALHLSSRCSLVSCTLCLCYDSSDLFLSILT